MATAYCPYVSLKESNSDELFDSNEYTRRFIRHPSGIPIHFSVEKSEEFNASPLRDISRGGVCFESHQALRIGSRIQLEIPVKNPSFLTVGRVAWCLEEGNHFAVGVAFDSASEQFSVRMVEQVCYIEHYRSTIRKTQGRELSSEAAAQEWVEKFAAQFPH
jgi:hypothetical protein